jgi:raffinose/stachyose/melibiose transport system substrate-binding protein
MAKRFLMAMLLLCLMMPAWAQSKPATVTIWGWRAQDVDVWKSVETALKAKGEQITIKYEVFPPTEYDSKLLVSLQGGVGPDLMYTRRLPGARTQALIDNSYLVPLDSSVDLSNFDNVSLSFIRSNNKTWGVPFANQIVGIFYNKAMFDKYKLKEPQTWDELVQVAETLQKNGITPFFVSGKEAWTLAMQNAMVGVSYPGDAWIGKLAEGKAKFTDPEYVNMLKDLNALKKYYQKDFMANTTAEQDVAFAMEQVAMVFYGVWGNTNWLKTNPDLKFDYFPVPPKRQESSCKSVYLYGWRVWFEQRIQEQRCCDQSAQLCRYQSVWRALLFNDRRDNRNKRRYHACIQADSCQMLQQNGHNCIDQPLLGRLTVRCRNAQCLQHSARKHAEDVS